MVTRRKLLQGAAGALVVPVSGLHAAPLRAVPGRPEAHAAAAHLLGRVAYGPLPGQIDEVARDPLAWLEGQLAPQRLALPPALQQRLSGESLFVGADPMEAVRTYNELNAAIRTEVARAAAERGPAMGDGKDPPAVAAAREAFGQLRVQYQAAASESRIQRALASPAQLQELMVDFWFNHFNVSQDKGYCRVLTGHYEHAAIRPHAMGRFRDLLGATAKHPAMLVYLDNWTSVGVARGRQQGLNENYARELMELHTLGVDGGYSQADVTALARMLTGWTLPPLRPSAAQAAAALVAREESPGFRFDASRHAPGDKQWLGRQVPAGGQDEGEFALDVLAAHPTTARHVCRKLAQFFVADVPDPALVARLAKVFLARDGQVVPVLRALFEEPAFWSPPMGEARLFKTPTHYAFSALRAVGATPSDLRPLLQHLTREGMPLYRCQSPDGYKTTEAAWLSPGAMQRRIEFALRVARGFGRGDDAVPPPPVERLIADLGPLVTLSTRDLALQNKSNPALAVALVLAGPAMMRR